MAGRRRKDGASAEAEAGTAVVCGAEDGAGTGGVEVTGKRLELRSIDSIIPYARNARVHDSEQIAKLRGSLRQFGFVKPLTIDEDGNLLTGHGILTAARAEGMTEVPCVVVTGISEVDRQAYIIADNALSDLSAWDPKMRELEVKRLKSLGANTGLLGLKTGKLGTVDVGAYTRTAPGESGETETDDAPPAEEDDYDGSLPESCPHKPGDVFKLGRHLLVCGDCTRKDAVSKFQAGGGKPPAD